MIATIARADAKIETAHAGTVQSVTITDSASGQGTCRKKVVCETPALRAISSTVTASNSRSENNRSAEARRRSTVPVELTLKGTLVTSISRPKDPLRDAERSFSILTMRSAPPDLTTRARIRDAAIARFGERGFAGTSLRQIAQDAAVSPALILHHFGSKEGLREACDAHVVSTFASERDGMTGADTARLMREALDSLEHRYVALDYLAGMLVDDSAASDRLFDAFLASTREMLREQIAAGTMREQTDLEATAVYMTLYGLGPIILRRHLARSFGESGLTTSLLERSTIPVLELYTHGLYADDRLLVAAKDALSRRSGPRSDKGENDPNQDPDPPR